MSTFQRKKIYVGMGQECVVVIFGKELVAVVLLVRISAGVHNAPSKRSD